MHLVVPAVPHLTEYGQALRRGWSPNTERPEAAAEELATIERDPEAFLASLDDRDAVGPPITLPDGSTVSRLPGVVRWMWDDRFVGSIGFRWQRGTEALPPTCLGHIGYSVVPWERHRGHATAALGAMLPLARAEGLRWVELTTDPGNVFSRRVIEANGGELVEEFVMPEQYGGGTGLRYRIPL